MVSRRFAILATVSAMAPSMSHATKPKSHGVRAKVLGDVEKIATDSVRPEYVPLPTRLRKLGQPSGESHNISLEDKAADLPHFFASARDFFRLRYKGSVWETQKVALEKKYPGYEIIPYLVAPATIVSDRDQHDAIEMIYMARKKNPKPSSSDDWLLEWIGPVESELDVDIMGTAPKAKTYEQLTITKTLGAGSNFQIYDNSTLGYEGNGRPYLVLATHYPQYGKQEANIQTPFSEGLASPQILEHGKQYFEALQTQVTKRLAEASWAEGLRDIEWYKIIQGLILTENMNPAAAGLSDAEEIFHYERELRKVYAILGANREFAFRRSSNMGAKGIVQFTEAAWEGRGEAWDRKNKKGQRTGIRHNFLLPGFPTNPDFPTVIADHILSILAACAHVTSQYQEYRESKIASMFHSISDSVKQVVLAAGYNSNNTKRVGDFSRAQQNGEGGATDILNRFYRILSNTGADETRGYMRKFLFALKSLGYSVPETSFFRLHGYNPRE